jgi:hypothetical protein
LSIYCWGYVQTIKFILKILVPAVNAQLLLGKRPFRHQIWQVRSGHVFAYIVQVS